MDEKKKQYIAFGLTVEAEIDLPELILAAGRTDVHIIFGKTPDHLQAPLAQTPWYEAEPGRYLLRVDGIATYYAENGDLIIIEPYPNAKPEDVRIFLLNTVLRALLHQRDYLVLHGAVAMVDSKSLALLGHSGVGKTTVALNLYDRGYEMLSDEICAMKLQEGKPVVFPGIPQLNVWRDTLEKADKEVNLYQPIRQGIEKYAFPVGELFSRKPVELGNIILLANHNGPEIESVPLKGGVCFERLMRNAYCIETVANKAEHFRIGAAIVKQAAICQLTFNEHSYQADQITDFILKGLR